MPMGGRDGYVSYNEGPNIASFYWEFGGEDIVAIVYVGKPASWTIHVPWAAERRQEILERVIEGIIEARAPDCRFKLDEEAGFLYILSRSQDCG